MHNPSHALKGSFATALQLSLLAASTSFVLAAPAAAQADLDILVTTLDILPGSSDTLLGVAELRLGADDAWAATAQVRTVAGASEFVVLGDPTPDGSQGATVLRRPMSIGGQTQLRLGRPDILGGQVAYLASSDSTTILNYESAWIDDQLIAMEGAPVGSSGRTWGKLFSVILRPGGKVFLRGQTSAGGVIFAQHADSVLLSIGDLVPTLGEPITRIERVAYSPNGDHWLARVRYGANNLDAIMLDGSLLSAAGEDVTQFEDVGLGLGLGVSVWTIFDGMAVDNSGRVTLQAFVNGESNGAVTIRGDRLVAEPVSGAPFRQFIGNAFGSLAAYFEGATVFLEEETIVAADATIDADGDSLPDAGYGLGTNTTGQADWNLVVGSEQIIGSVFIDVPNMTGDQQAIVRLQRGLQSSDVCDGVRNSTGRPAELEAFGRSGASVNDLTLYCVDLPTGCVGYAIASQQAGFVANPGGSTGNLCLGGSIGRLVDQMFTVGVPGRGTVSLDLAAVPQPMGTAAVTAGDIWFFQVWHRDTCATGATSNFSNAVSVQFTN